MWLGLERVKKHLNFPEDVTEEDDYLKSLIEVAELAVEKHIGSSLSDIANEEGGALPSPLLHGMLLLIGNLYANRESISFSSVHELPLSYDYLLGLYRNYKSKGGYT